jgi:hypothetical protein
LQGVKGAGVTNNFDHFTYLDVFTRSSKLIGTTVMDPTLFPG